MFIGLFLLKNKHEILVIRLNEFWRLKKGLPKIHTYESKWNHFTCTITKISAPPRE